MVHVLWIELARMLVLLTLRLGFFLCQSQSERQLSLLHLCYSLLFPGELKRRLLPFNEAGGDLPPDTARGYTSPCPCFFWLSQEKMWIMMKQCSFKLLTMFHDSQVHWSSRQMKSYWKSKHCVVELLVNCLCLIDFFWKLSEHNSLGLCLLVDIVIMKYVIKNIAFNFCMCAHVSSHVTV